MASPSSGSTPSDDELQLELASLDKEIEEGERTIESYTPTSSIHTGTRLRMREQTALIKTPS
jgi:hypothetical protein